MIKQQRKSKIFVNIKRNNLIDLKSIWTELYKSKTASIFLRPNHLSQRTTLTRGKMLFRGANIHLKKMVSSQVLRITISLVVVLFKKLGVEIKIKLHKICWLKNNHRDLVSSQILVRGHLSNLQFTCKSWISHHRWKIRIKPK